ncbi:MAG: hypothetical protein AAGH70_13975 [Pseudomonadota bacterium]
MLFTTHVPRIDPAQPHTLLAPTRADARVSHPSVTIEDARDV